MNETSKKSKKKEALNYLNAFLFLLPALILFFGILILPVFSSLRYSFCDWNGMGAKTFIGFDNYIELFTSPAIGFWKALLNSLLLALLSVFIQLPISLIFALLLGKGIKGERLFLSVYFMPVLISTVVIGQLWLKIYNPEYGVLNVVLSAIGNLFVKAQENNIPVIAPLSKAIGDFNVTVASMNIPVISTVFDLLTPERFGKVGWLGEVKTALGACFIPTLWQYVGYHMLLMYAGVKGVSPDLREAAMIDGASDSQINRYIVIPNIKSIIKVSVIFAVTGSLKSFDLIYVLTNGGPFHSTEVPSTLMINMLFLRNRYGMGSAIAVMLIILCFAFALIISAIFKEEK